MHTYLEVGKHLKFGPFYTALIDTLHTEHKITGFAQAKKAYALPIPEGMGPLLPEYACRINPQTGVLKVQKSTLFIRDIGIIETEDTLYRTLANLNAELIRSMPTGDDCYALMREWLTAIRMKEEQDREYDADGFPKEKGEVSPLVRVFLGGTPRFFTPEGFAEKVACKFPSFHFYVRWGKKPSDEMDYHPNVVVQQERVDNESEDCPVGLTYQMRWGSKKMFHDDICYFPLSHGQSRHVFFSEENVEKRKHPKPWWLDLK